MTMSGEHSSLATQCLAFCQALASPGKAFHISLTIGSDFCFSLDTGEKTPPAKPKTPPAKGKIPPVKERTTSAKGEVRKKKSPSTLRRNAERREEFLKKEPKVVKSAPVKSASDTESNT